MQKKYYKFTEYAYGTLEGVVLCELKGMGEYDLPPRVTNIKKVFIKLFI